MIAADENRNNSLLAVAEPVRQEPTLSPIPPCSYPKCPSHSEHDHHITYNPNKTIRLCEFHHNCITQWNYVFAGLYNCRSDGWKSGLSDKDRQLVHDRWMRGELDVAPRRPWRKAASAARKEARQACRSNGL